MQAKEAMERLLALTQPMPAGLAPRERLEELRRRQSELELLQAAARHLRWEQARRFKRASRVPQGALSDGPHPDAALTAQEKSERLALAIKFRKASRVSR